MDAFVLQGMSGLQQEQNVDGTIGVKDNEKVKRYILKAENELQFYVLCNVDIVFRHESLFSYSYLTTTQTETH